MATKRNNNGPKKIGNNPHFNHTAQQFLTADGQPMACEICGVVVTDHSKLFSVMVSFPMPASPGISGYNCPQVQHFAHSYEHAILSAIACLLSDLDSEIHGGGRNAAGGFDDPLIQQLDTLIQQFY